MDIYNEVEDQKRDISQYQDRYIIKIANQSDFKYLPDIIDEINRSAKERETGIVDRTVGYLKRKINEGFAVIIIDKNNNEWVAFSSLEVWFHDRYVSNTALIVRPKYRGNGLLKILKTRIVQLAKELFPNATLFSLTASPAILKANLQLGYTEVPFDYFRNDQLFIEGNESEVDYFQLMNKGFNAEGKYVAMILDLKTIA
jgi:GNAT superfamily N-acetyltransferase